MTSLHTREARAADARRGRIGVLSAVAAYGMWGMLPSYFHLLQGFGPLQILAHRILWSLLALIVIVGAAGRFGRVRTALAAFRLRLMLLCSASLLAINWVIYIWAVQNEHVLEASLGYFINPLVNIALGVAVLGERLRSVQLAALALAVAGVLVMALGGGSFWIPLALAVTFALYGLVRKMAPVDALSGVLGETLILAPAALALLYWLAAKGVPTFPAEAHVGVLLALSGVITATPLFLFAVAAKRMRYSTLGLIQFIAPTLQFLQGVLLNGEPFTTRHAVTFGCIWTGCAVYAASLVRGAR